MIMIQKCVFVLAVLLTYVLFVLQAHAQDAPKTPVQPAKKSMSSPRQQLPDSGEQVFAQNCSRCHAAPDGFPPRISGTIVMHMRVRASLSQNEAKALLRFLNP
jgi:cytochrome c5